MEKKGRKKVTKDKIDFNDSDNGDGNVWWWIPQKGVLPAFLCVAVFGLLVRLAVSLHSYSGAGIPPKFGDYEAQRHWMEITINLPAKEWYRNSTDNDLSYWGLDYPPLTAYQSYVHGLFLKYFDPNSVALFTSRGYESYLGKLLMRWTVLSSDALMFFPSVLYFILVYYPSRVAGSSSSPIFRKSEIAWHTAIILVKPCLILIDHGHFQFNCISLGLTLGAVAAILSNNELLACVLFCSSLNHKQLVSSGGASTASAAPPTLAQPASSLPSTVIPPSTTREAPVPTASSPQSVPETAPAVAAPVSHLLGKCLRRKNPVLEVSKLGLVVLGTFAIIWWPYLHSREAFFEVLSRLAPFERGIYEDYVANFWCSSSMLIKWKKLFTTQSLKLLSLVATVLACLPSMIQQIIEPSSKGFLYGLLNSSFAFYLFSFQVHEKSILLPLLPATLLVWEFPWPFYILMHYALVSMFPLMCRDKLIVPYIALHALFALVYFAPGGRRRSMVHLPAPAITSLVVISLYLYSLMLHVIYLTVLPPEKYPFLFEALIMTLCFCHFFCFAVHTNGKQWMMSRRVTSRDKQKKHN